MVLSAAARIPGVPPRNPHVIDDLLDQYGTDLTTLDGRVDTHDTEIAARLTEAQADLLYPEKVATEAAVARVDPGTAGSAGQMLGWDSTGTPAAISTTLNARAYGLHPDNTAAENTTALDAAVAAVADRGRIFIPEGHYAINNLTPVAKSYTLVGDGASWTAQQEPYGGASYTSANFQGGTVLMIESATGAFLDGSSIETYGKTINLENITLLGVGDATRTNTGVSIGTTTASGPALMTAWRNVVIANLAIGMTARMMFQAKWDNVQFIGCKQAYNWATACNQNTVDQFKVDSCGAPGVNIVQMDGCTMNLFSGVTLQTNIAGTVIKLQNAAEGNRFNSIYSENWTTDYAVDVEAGCDRNTFDDLHLGGGGGDNMRVASSTNKIRLGKYVTGTVVDTGAQNEWDISALSGIPTGFATNYPSSVKMYRTPLNVTNAMSPYAVTLADDILWCNTTSGDITITLPPANTQIGRSITVKKTAAANVLYVDGGASIIDFSLIRTITADQEVMTVVCDGSVWRAM